MSKIDQNYRAHQAWEILVHQAEKRDTITYGAMSAIMGIHHRPSRYFLGLIQDFCKQNSLPPLSILVTNAKGLPGPGFTEWPLEKLEEGKKLVCSFNWRNIQNPFPNAFEEARNLGIAGIIDLILSSWENYKSSPTVDSTHDSNKAVTRLFPLLLDSYITDSDYSKAIKLDHLMQKGSTGQGNSTAAPWIATFDTRNTKSATSGIYPVYLFSKDLKRLYLSLGLGAQQFEDAYGANKVMEQKLVEALATVRQLQTNNPLKPTRLAESVLDLGAVRTDKRHYWYERGSVFNFPAYDTANIDPAAFKRDYLDMLKFYQSIVEDPLLPSMDSLILRSPPKHEKRATYIEFIDLPVPEKQKAGKKSKRGGALFAPEESTKIGNFGEEYVLEQEKRKLIAIGRDDLADEVYAHCQHKDFCGWDITSFDEQGEELYIEVKATKTKSLYGFVISTNEWETCKKHPDKYVIYRVLNVLGASPSIVVIRDIPKLVAGNRLSVSPLSYIISGSGD